MGKPALSLAALHAQLLAMVMDGGMKDALPLACAIPNEQMSTAKYRTHLIRLNIIEESDNDMDVFHIVASAHGGADHPHNYNIAQGSGYNRSIGARYDDLNIYFVGKARAQKAIQVSMDLGNTSRRRNGKQPIKYTPQHSSTADGEANYRYQAGERMFKCMRGDKNEVEEASRRPEEEEEEDEDSTQIDACAKDRVVKYLLWEYEEQVAAVSTEEQRAELRKMFDNVKNWLITDGRNVSQVVYQEKENELRTKGDFILSRLAELERRPAAVQSARAIIAASVKTIGTWAEAEPQIREEDTAKVGKKLVELEKAVRMLGKKPKPVLMPTP
mmetsp:Transcript_18761/g.44205  ORF Transcript_18761/g.44205 Transcript_18761/m.44205 type:complete len:329 (+) Transcript_18761:708-1694(+)